MPLQIRTFDSDIEQRIHDNKIEKLQRCMRELELQAELEGRTLIHPPQKRVAEMIAAQFFSFDALIATLCASMQWGKTGVMLQLAYTLMTHPALALTDKNLFVITGMADNEWREQTKKRLPDVWEKRVFHQKDLKADSLQSELTNTTNALIIIDECHYGAHKGSVISDILKKAGLLNISTLQQKNIRIFQTSATPDHVLANAEEWNQSGGPIYHYKCVPENPPSYVSPKDIMADGRIRPVMDLSSPPAVGTLRDQMLGYETPKYHVIRLPIRNAKKRAVCENINTLCGYPDFDVKTHDSDDRLEEVDKLLRSRPSRHTIILIKSMWRAAKTIPDTHLGVLHEAYAVTSSDSAVAQSFVGRCCGHNANRTVSAPIIYCNVPSIENYIKLMEGAYNYSLPALDYHAQNINKVSGSEVTLKASWAASANIDGLDAVEREITTNRDQPEPIIRKFSCYAKAKEYYLKVARQSAQKQGKDPSSLRGCRYPQVNADGFFECNVRSNTKVWSIAEMHEERRWGMTRLYYRLRYCYRDTSDPTTLEWWVVHDRSLVTKIVIHS